ncbi:MAG TPA: transglutaminase family protein, partial [Casimicrobiaceae bacterium]
FFVEPYAEQYPFAYAPALAKELIPFLEVAPQAPRLARWIAAFRDTIRPGESTVNLLVRLNQQLQQEIRYLVRMEPGVQAPEETLERACGSCRDSGWLLVQIMRALGVAARFASGYLIQLKSDVKPLDGPAGAERDFTDLHAWAEAYIPGAGWIGFDPTSGLLAGEGHLPLACTADPGNAAPVIGFSDVAGTTFEVAMHVSRIHEDPRVTKPYTEAEWARIHALGRQVDVDLVAHDVRLTQGGEPTFVSIDDMDGPEWNTIAMSPEKRDLAETLQRRLKARFAPGGLLHQGQGKWYPGEPLPRWSLGIYWRTDGDAMWSDDGLLADTTTQGHATFETARAFATALAHKLGIPDHYIITAHEDAPKLLIEESALPANVDPLQADLSSAAERARLARLLQAGLDQTAGFVLPLKATHEHDGGAIVWETSPWPIRRERLYLLAGDSPLGLRLPLGSLPDTVPDAHEFEAPVDPFAPHDALPHRSRHEARSHLRGGTAREVIKTALTVEARGGHVRVFMPPLTRMEAYAALIATIENTAAALATPVAVEGYAPPRDARVRVLQVTPDPGVIEVNIHPAPSWDELIETTTML